MIPGLINNISLPTKFLFQLLNPFSAIAHITAKRSTSLPAKVRSYLVRLQKAKFCTRVNYANKTSATKSKRETKQEFESHLQQKRTEILTPTFTGQYLRWESFSPLKLPRIKKFVL